MWTKWDSRIENILIIGINVYDCLVNEKLESISKLIVDFKGHEFSSKIEENVIDYLICHSVETIMRNKIVMV